MKGVFYIENKIEKDLEIGSRVCVSRLPMFEGFKGTVVGVEKNTDNVNIIFDNSIPKKIKRTIKKGYFNSFQNTIKFKNMDIDEIVINKNMVRLL